MGLHEWRNLVHCFVQILEARVSGVEVGLGNSWSVFSIAEWDDNYVQTNIAGKNESLT